MRSCHARRVIRQAAPDVVLLDLSLPDGSTHDILETLSGPQLAVVVLTMHDDAETAARCLGAGALGFLLKGSSSAAVVSAARAVADGLTSAEVAESLGRAVKTVRNYRERLLAKLEVRTTAAMVRVATRNGWIR